MSKKLAVLVVCGLISFPALAQNPQPQQSVPSQVSNQSPYPYIIYVSIRDSNLTVQLRYKNLQKAQEEVNKLDPTSSVATKAEKVVDESGSVFIIIPAEVKMAFLVSEP